MSMINFSTDKIISVLITKPVPPGQSTPAAPATILPIARVRGTNPPLLRDTYTGEPVILGSPTTVVFNVPRGQQAVFSIETDSWEPGYDIASVYYLSDDWPFPMEDLPYDARNDTACRLDGDSVITLSFDQGWLSWSSPALSPQTLNLTTLKGKRFFASVRLARGSDPVTMNVTNGGNQLPPITV